MSVLRQFWDGLRAIPERGRIWYLNCLVDERDASLARMSYDLIQCRRWLRDSQTKLDAEREAHAATSADCHRLANANHSLSLQLEAEHAAHEETKANLWELSVRYVPNWSDE